MIGYAFLPETPTIFYKPVYPSALEALNWATGRFLYQVAAKGNLRKEKDGIVSDSMIVLARMDSSQVLQNFARNCAYRAVRTFSDNHVAPDLPGLYQWLHNDKIRPDKWSNFLHWAETTEMLWMNGGHAEASICNAVLSHCGDRNVWYHSWLAGAHTQMLLGKTKEFATQEKSLKQMVNKELSYAA